MPVISSNLVVNLTGSTIGKYPVFPFCESSRTCPTVLSFECRITGWCKATIPCWNLHVAVSLGSSSERWTYALDSCRQVSLRCRIFLGRHYSQEKLAWGTIDESLNAKRTVGDDLNFSWTFFLGISENWNLQYASQNEREHFTSRIHLRRFASRRVDPSTLSFFQQPVRLNADNGESRVRWWAQLCRAPAELLGILVTDRYRHYEYELSICFPSVN